MQQMNPYNNCIICPRNCGKNRMNGEIGICGRTSEIYLARAALHLWEEPCISGRSGSGTVFFSGCSMHCVFCQNREIANGRVGKKISFERLVEIFMELQEKGANNINLVTADHYIPTVALALQAAKREGLTLPVVYNTGSYITVESLLQLEGLVDIYLPDFKYYDASVAEKYAKAKDYPEVAKKAIAEMVRQTGEPLFYNKKEKRELKAEEYNAFTGEDEVILKKGTIVRHLLLPKGMRDSKAVIRYLLKTYGERIYISILNQYTPMKVFENFPELNQKVLEEEYEEIIDYAIALGIENGFVQEGDTAQESFIPAFDYEGV